MKRETSTHLYYFTGTGNTLWVGKQLQSLIPNAELIPIVRFVNQDSVSVECERAGFLFPLYFFGLPEVVRKLVQQTDLGGCAYVFGVCTGGLPSFLAGGAAKNLGRLLRAKGRGLDAFFYAWMPGNCVVGYGAMPGLLVRAQLKLARRKAQRIARTVRSQERHMDRQNAVVSAAADSIHANWVAKLPDADKAFWVDENCDGCGICERACPVANLVLEGGRPTWRHRCQQCMACIQLCPQQAIQYGKRTERRRRYRNPEIEVTEILAQRAR